jgi:NAD(P)-dependent dehydrogenase (short-subunit alcohol dehydrogenase family)
MAIPVHVISADLPQPAVPVQAIAQAVAQFARVDLPVSSAGATKRADVFTVTDEDWQMDSR